MTEHDAVKTDIQVRMERDAAVVLLNRHEKRNALSAALVAELTRLVDELSSSDVRVVLLGAAEGTFSTGVDLNEAVQITTEQAYASASAAWRQLTDCIRSCTKPVVACISGYCLTGGLELALACDLRIADDDALFGVTSARIGSVAGIGATQRLPRLVGPSRAKQLLLTGRFINAREAYRIGLVDELTAPGGCIEAGLRFAEEVSATAPLSVSWHKQAVDQGMELPLDEALDLESKLSMQAFMTRDKEEGMTAFLEGRPPKFQGR